MYVCIYIYIYIYVCVCVFVCAYIYTERVKKNARMDNFWRKKIKNLIKTFRSGIFFRGLSYYFQITDESLWPKRFY